MKKKEKKPVQKLFGTRYPLDVLAGMKQLAEQHGRSFNAPEMPQSGKR